MKALGMYLHRFLRGGESKMGKLDWSDSNMNLFIEKFRKFNQKISAWMEWVGVFALVFIMGTTCVDVVGAKLFHTPVFGAIDMIMIVQLVGISFAAAMVLILGSHIGVDFFLLLFPRCLRVILECIVDLLGFVLFMVVVWRLFVYGHSLQIGGEVSATARIPLYPFAYGAGVACIPICLVYMQRFIQLVMKGEKK